MVYFYPTTEGTSDAINHRKLHTNLYYQNVEKLLEGVESKEVIIDVLGDIKEQLLEGTFPH